ncbi:MAG: hypothetical protein ACREHD_26440, partial [Pirellulales bacterium]
RRWFVDFVHAAQVFDVAESVEEAWRLLSQAFSGREKSSYGNLMADLERCRAHCANPGDHRQIARKIAELALQLVWDFDDVLERRISNASCCQIGDLTPPSEGNRLVPSLGRFCREFCEPVMDCGVNGFLAFEGNDTAVRKIIASDLMAKNKKYAEPLASYQKNRAHITCRECGRIGDAIIAAEHAAQMDADEYCLLHVDHAFDRYCECLGLKHEKMPAAIALEDLPRHPGR